MGDENALRDVRARLVRLRPVANTRASMLANEQKDDFMQLQQYTVLFYDTSIYPAYYDLVQSVFGDLPDIKPGTVGSYFAGCAREVQGINSICSPLCAGSMPLPNTNGTNNICDKTVIYEGNHRGNSRWDVLLDRTKNAPISNEAVVVVRTNNPPLATLKGQLQRMGIDRIDIYQADSNGTNYRHLRAVDVEDIPNNDSPNPVADNSWIWILAMIALIAFVTIVVCITRH